MLTTSLPQFQQKLHNILKESATSAFMKTLDTVDSNVTSASQVNNKFNAILKKTAEKFGNEFATKAAPELAKEIMNYIQSASLSIVVQPQGLATIVSPVGPCTGTLAINDATATINIL